MSYWTGQHVHDAAQGQWLAEPSDDDAKLGAITTDTRSLEAGQVFVALRGDRFDAHDFLEQAVQRGAAMLIVSNEQRARSLRAEHVAILLVPNTLTALQNLAHHYRDVLAGASTKVIAVTGSNGKTTTRNLIHAVLSASLRGTQSPRSFNNHIGVPLTLLASSTDDDFVVAELGSNHPGEIESLARIVRPDAAVITNIGSAHIGLFGSRDAIAHEKGMLLQTIEENGLAVVPADEPRLGDSLGKAHLSVHVVCVGTDIRCEQVQPTILGRPMSFTVAAAGEQINASLRLLGRHNIDNALAAIAVGQWFGINDDQIVQALAGVQAVDMRAQIVVRGGITFINDAYNANPDSMRGALEMLVQTRTDRQDMRRVAILGDMLELGESAEAEHRALATQLVQYGDQIDLAVLIGKLAMLTAEELAGYWPPNRFGAWEHWDDTLPKKIGALLRKGDLVLLKASRAMALERLITDP